MNYIEGLFLSSAVIQNPDYTTELMIRTLAILREKHRPADRSGPVRWRCRLRRTWRRRPECSAFPAAPSKTRITPPS